MRRERVHALRVLPERTLGLLAFHLEHCLHGHIFFPVSLISFFLHMLMALALQDIVLEKLVITNTYITIIVIHTSVVRGFLNSSQNKYTRCRFANVSGFFTVVIQRLQECPWPALH